MKRLGSLAPFAKYCSIVILLLTIVVLVMPYATFDFAVVFLFGVLVLSPVVFIGHIVVVYKIGRKMQQTGAYSRHWVRVALSLLCGIIIGLIFPMALVIQDILKWGHFNYRLIVNSFIGDFESNWPTQMAVIFTAVFMLWGMEREYKTAKGNLESAETVSIDLEQVEERNEG